MSEEHLISDIGSTITFNIITSENFKKHSLDLFSAHIRFLICYKAFTLNNHVRFRTSRENLIKHL